MKLSIMTSAYKKAGPLLSADQTAYKLEFQGTNYFYGRANYYAMTALLADVYLWAEQYQKSIDACDEIMDTIGFDRGLIRYASENNIVKGEKFEYNSRIISYIVVLTLLFSFFVTLLFLRNDVQANFLHLPGQLYTTSGDEVSNVYTFKIINKTNNPYEDIKIKLISHDGLMQVVGSEVNLPKSGLYEGTVFVKIDKDKLSDSKEKIRIGIYSKGELIEETHTNFSSPLQIK